MINRRNFIKQSSMTAGSLLLASHYACTPGAQPLTGILSGANATIGHKIRDGFSAGKPTEIIREDIVIVGGGVSGLSAARWLNKSGQSFRLLEMEAEAGGNSRAGKNAVSSYPMGAHYLPVPNSHYKELLTFLEECEVITGYENGLPIYNEYFLCFDPKERLYINHHWQEGLIPNDGVPASDHDEIKRFLQLMDDYRHQIGQDGKHAFEIPISESSQDPSLLKLDMITMDSFLREQNFKSPYLRWYVNYCCTDDYGASLEDTSAWAGIHYFASRGGKAANAKNDDVLTWPEGNHWLVKQLTKDIQHFIHSQCAVIAVRPMNNHVEVDYLDIAKNEVKRIEAKAVIMSSPQFLNKYLLQSERGFDYSTFHYAPWMVANLTVASSLQEKRGELLCWDNVIYGSKSLGYVHAQHQSINAPLLETVISYYQPLTGHDCATQRKLAQQNTWEDWTKSIFEELKSVHPELRKATSNINVHLWGHGMIRPGPGFTWGCDRTKASTPIDGKIFFAHSDLSGVSVFEEAFSTGIAAARNLIASV